MEMRSATRKGRARTLRYLLGVVAVCALAFGVPSSARPAEGDLLRTLNPPGAAFGVSVGFDGTRVYYTNFNGTTLFSVLPDGTAPLAVPIVGAAGGINAFSYDARRDIFWAAGGLTGREIYQLDQTGIATLAFTITNTPGNCKVGCLTLIDGMAYDGFSDTVWWSPDASRRVYEYTTTTTPAGPPGTFVRFFDVDIPPNDTAAQCGFNYSSGIAVATATQIYNVANGCRFIFRYSKTGVKESFFAYQGQRGEDAECDDVTFPVTAIWVRDVDGSIEAFEVIGECPVGGGPVVPCPPEDDDDDGDDEGRDDDGDDDGVDDEEESLFGNLLHDSDSDDDGIVDGNDDGDGDGEDDEDEDDDDECPDDDDEDGDGEDDEDEDDDEDDD
jgi:hypothetical protein